MDEFALWVHPEGVYWSKEGRISLAAVILVAAFMTAVVPGIRPFGLHNAISVGLTVFAVMQALVLSIVSFLKGRIGLGVIAIFIPLFGLWATFRLAKPQSPWARWFCRGPKLERAAPRFPPDRRGARFRDRFFDAIGGRPSEVDPSRDHRRSRLAPRSRTRLLGPLSSNALCLSKFCIVFVTG